MIPYEEFAGRHGSLRIMINRKLSFAILSKLKNLVAGLFQVMSCPFFSPREFHAAIEAVNRAEAAEPLMLGHVLEFHVTVAAFVGTRKRKLLGDLLEHESADGVLLVHEASALRASVAPPVAILAESVAVLALENWRCWQLQTDATLEVILRESFANPRSLC